MVIVKFTVADSHFHFHFLSCLDFVQIISFIAAAVSDTEAIQMKWRCNDHSCCDNRFLA